MPKDSIYNPSNQKITLNDVQNILVRFGVPGQVRNIKLYQRAFVHRSYLKTSETQICPKGCIPLQSKSNERLEFIGDGVLECITKMYLYRRFPKEDEGYMTEKKIALVKNEHLGKLSLALELNKWLLVSKQYEEKNMRTNLKQLGCVFEAFLGAMFLDFNGLTIKDEAGIFENFLYQGIGYQICNIFLEGVFNKCVNWSSIIHTHDNYKNILQTIMQKLWRITPIYITLDQNSGDNYEVGVFMYLGMKENVLDPLSAIPIEMYENVMTINEEYKRTGYVFIKMGVANHKIKKKAEQLSCKNAIAYINSHIPPSAIQW